MEIEKEQHIISLCLDPSTREEGYRQLMKAYQEKVYWHIRRTVHFHDDANDVLQNTFIKVFRYLSNFKQECSLFTWIYRIASNECYSFLKSKKRKNEESLDEQVENLGERLKADQYFDSSQGQIQLIKAIERLPLKQRTVFNMRYFDEISYRELSEILETSEGALKASYHHAVNKIEDYLKNT